MQTDYRERLRHGFPWAALMAPLALLVVPSVIRSQTNADADKPKDNVSSSYDQIAPVLLGKESFQDVMAKDKAARGSVMARQNKLLQERYDLTPHPDPRLTMSRGKPIQVGPTAKLPEGMTWEKLAAMSSGEVRDR